MNDTYISPGKNASQAEENNFHSFLLCVLIFLTTILSAEYYSLIFLSILLIYKYAYGVSTARNASGYLIKPLVLMMVSGAFFSHDNQLYDVLKDLWYIGKAIVCILLGYYVGIRIADFGRFLNLLVWTLFVSALVYLFKTFDGSLGASLFERVSLTDRFPLISALIIPLILNRRLNFYLKSSPIIGVLILTTVLAAFLLSFSRTAIVCLILLAVSCAGLFDSKSRWMTTVVLLAIIAIFSNFILPDAGNIDIPFFEKASRSFSEIFFSGQSEFEDMILRWRGYETYRAYLDFIDANFLQQIFGRGWGATVDLGLSVQISDEMNYEYIPILHNGYFHILTKYGVVGVMFYVIFLWRVTVTSRVYFSSKDNLEFARIMTGLGLVLVFTSAVITGILNKENLDATLIVIGFLSASAYLPNRVQEAKL